MHIGCQHWTKAARSADQRPMRERLSDGATLRYCTKQETIENKGLFANRGSLNKALLYKIGHFDVYNTSYDAEADVNKPAGIIAVEHNFYNILTSSKTEETKSNADHATKTTTNNAKKDVTTDRVKKQQEVKLEIKAIADQLKKGAHRIIFNSNIDFDQQVTSHNVVNIDDICSHASTSATKISLDEMQQSVKDTMEEPLHIQAQLSDDVEALISNNRTWKKYKKSKEALKIDSKKRKRITDESIIYNDN